MKRLALLLAASFLGTGCIATSDNCSTRTVSVGWPSFLLANGAHTSSCSAAGVTFVDVFMDDQPIQPTAEFPCAQGGVSVVGVPSGAHRFTVEGLDAGHNILLRDEITVNGGVCGEQLVSTEPAEGTLDIAYAFASGPTCNPGSFIWFAVFDQIAGKVTAVADETSNTQTYACGNPITFPMPVGPYTLTRIEEVTPSGGTLVPTANNCAQNGFTVNAASLSTLAVTLADANALCPATAGLQSAPVRAKIVSAAK